MNVKLIAISKPATPECTSASELISFCARVSNPNNQANHQTSDRLLMYMADNHHWSPFEMAHMVLEIETSRDIARQILRHRSFSFQEFSQRYAHVSEIAEPRHARLQDSKNRQSSIELSESQSSLNNWWITAQENVLAASRHAYKLAIDKGIAKEVARAVLPEGLTKSRLYMAGTIRSWIHYCQLRCANGTQKEHREIAFACREILLEQFPALTRLFE